MLAPHNGPRWFPPMEPPGEPPEEGSAAPEPPRIENPRPGAPPSRPPVWATTDQPPTSPPVPDAPQAPAARAVRPPAAPEWLSEPTPTPKAKKRKTRPAKLSAPAAPKQSRVKPRSVAIAVVSVVAFAGVVAGIIALAPADKDSETAVTATLSATSKAEEPMETTEPTAVVPAAACVNTRGGNLIRGNGVGSTTSGPDAIMAFEHAYYSERSGERARAVVAPDAAVAAAAQIQSGIDTVPLGTNHCVSIVDLAEGRYAVELSEFHPDKTSITYKQVVTTAVRDGRTVITAIAAAATP